MFLSTLVVATVVAASPSPSPTPSAAPTIRPIGFVAARVRTNGVSQTYVPREAYRDLGEQPLSSVLDQTAGVQSVHEPAEDTGTFITNIFPSINGSAVWETAVIFDGVRINLPSSGTVNLGLIPPVAVQNLNVYRDGDALGYPGGVAGTVDIHLLDATPGGARAFPEFGADGYGDALFNTTITGTPTKRIAFAFAANAEYRGVCCGDDGLAQATDVERLTYRIGSGTDVSLDHFETAQAYGARVDDGVLYGAFPESRAAGLTFSRGFTFENVGIAQALANGTAVALHGYAFDDSRTAGVDASDPTGRDNVIGQRLDYLGPLGGGAFTASLDHRYGSAFESFTNVYEEPPIAQGSSQQTTTASLAWDRAIAKHVSTQITLAESAIADAYEVGRTFTSAHYTLANDRLAFSYRPSAATTYRIGVAPGGTAPTLEMLSAPIPLTPNYVESQVAPRSLRFATSIAYDAGLTTPAWDPLTTVDLDLSRRVVHDFFVDESFDDALALQWRNGGTVTADAVDVSLSRHPRTGFGFVTALGLVHASQTDFLASSIPSNINSQGTAYGFGGLTQDRTPYANGYAEMSYHWPNGSRLETGATYYGTNNAFNEPAFFTVNANWEQQLDARSKFQFSIVNLLNTYGGFFPLAYQGSPLALGTRFSYPTSAAGPGPRTIRLLFRRSFGSTGNPERR
jgi:hypothetical protein